MYRIFRISILFQFILLSNLFVAHSQNDFYDLNTIQEIRITFKESNWSDILDSLIQHGDGTSRLVGDVSVNGIAFKNVGIRYKGFSSWDANYTKNPFNIDLNYTNPYSNYQEYTKLKLSNVIHDPSFVREVLSYEIARKYMPASKANFANVYVNNILIGLYTNVEAVDKDFVERSFDSHHHCFFKGDPATLEYPFGQNANLANTHGTDSSGYMPYYKLESDFGWSELYDFIYKLNVDTTQIDSVLNIDRTLWMHAINYSLLNLDSYIGYSQNYYMYKDDNGRFNPILWDLNMSFGSFRNSDGTSLSLTIPKIESLNPLQYVTQPSFTPRPLLKNILRNSTYSKMYIAHMRTILNENIKSNLYFERGQTIQSTIDANVQNDTNKFYSYADFTNNLSIDVGVNPNQYPGIKEIMEARLAYLDTFPGFKNPPSISQIAYSPELPEQGQNIIITAKVLKANKVVLGYRYKTFGLFVKTEMFDDGLHNDGAAGDSVYGVSIVTSGRVVQYYLYAENDTNGIFSPERAEYEFYSIQPKIKNGDIVINEICKDWIELYNTTKENLLLKGLCLTDEHDNITKWSLPDTLFNSKTYFILSKAMFDSTITIDNNRKLLLGYDKINLVDSILYGQLIDGKTIGRYPNAIGDFVYMFPTYSFMNTSGTTPEFSFDIYPNPARECIYIETENNNEPLTVEIFNSGGQTVVSKQFNYSKDLIQVISEPIDLSGLTNGIYLIKVTCKNKISTKKFIIC